MMSYIISTTILDKIDGKFRLSSSSRIKDDKMARFGFCAASFLISGGGGGGGDGGLLFYFFLSWIVAKPTPSTGCYHISIALPFSYGWAKTIQIHFVCTCF